MLSLARYGSSAAMIQWAQFNLSGAWGLQGVGAPLHRLTDSILSSNNREVICDSSFVANPAITAALAPYNDTDSCDEYPFASSYESGAMVDGVTGAPKPYVTTGANCAQVTAVTRPGPAGPTRPPTGTRSRSSERRPAPSPACAATSRAC